MKILSIFLAINLFFYNISFSQNEKTEDYSIIYIYRLKKSTNAAVTYKVIIDDKTVGKLKGGNLAFSSNYTGKWLVSKMNKTGSCLIKLMEKKKLKAKLLLNIYANKRYFIEFDPSAPYGENPLRLMENKEGYNLLLTSEMKNIEIVDEDIVDQVKEERENGYIEQEEIAEETPAVNENAYLTRGGDPLKGLNVSSAKSEMKIGKYYALIIGIDNYSGIWNHLNNAVNDAKAVEATLRSKYKIDYFKTLYNEKATRTNIITQLEWLSENVKEEDNVFIYYSGHGEFKENLNKGYWVPVDAKTKSTSQYISNNDIQTFLGGIKSKHTLLVSDACFSGDIFRGKTISVPYENTSKYYSKVHNLISRQAISSGGIEPVMDGGKDGHSVFAYYFLKSLKNNTSKYIDASQVFSDIKIPVTNNSEQSPKLSPVKNTGDEGGQFIFIRK